MQKFDLHMHTKYCDGNDTAEDMIKTAAELGLDHVGISGHSFTPFDQSYCMSRRGTDEYLDELGALRHKYAGRIRVLTGLELDLYADTDTSPYDYLIGSVHYVFTEEGRRKYEDLLSRTERPQYDKSAPEELVKYSDWCPVDDGPEDLLRFAEDQGISLMEVAELYYSTEARVVSGTGCDIIGHFDLITKFNGRGAQAGSRLIDTDDPRYVKAWKDAIDSIFQDCCSRYKNGYRNRLETAGLIEAGDKPVFEINYGAVAKGYRNGPYPSDDQIAYIRSKGGVLIRSSDAHRTDHIAYWKR